MSAKAKTDPLAEVASRYAVAITPAMEALIDPTNPEDPIAAQFRPDPRELEIAPDELSDPIGDDAHTPVKGVVHRYADRCLLKLVHVCPVYCRFCFRREMVGPDGDGTLTGAELEAALAYIESTPGIWEVILTGGDPFLLSARRVREITARLAAIPHVKIIRWHTRIPAVDPMRVTPDLVEALRVEGATTYVVLHTNHARELTDQARAAIARIVDSSIERGQDLSRELNERVSGVAQPTYVLDIPGGHGKAPLASHAVRKTGDAYEVRDRNGVWRPYKD